MLAIMRSLFITIVLLVASASFGAEIVVGSGDSSAAIKIDFDAYYSGDEYSFKYLFNSGSNTTLKDGLDAIASSIADFSIGYFSDQAEYVVEQISYGIEHGAAREEELLSSYWKIEISPDGEVFEETFASLDAIYLNDVNDCELTITVDDFSDYAVRVVDSNNLNPYSPYGEPTSVLGKPTVKYKYTEYFGAPGELRVTKIVDPPYNVDENGDKTILTLNANQSVVIEFDHKVVDDPGNLYGLDFIVFGNALYENTSSSVVIDDDTDMSDVMLSGSFGEEPVVVSVSQDGQNWYTYSDGPYGDSLYPTQGLAWDQDKYDSTGYGWTDVEMDFLKPVDPALQNELFSNGNVSAADVIVAYDGAGGGAGFDIAESGYVWIKYIKFTGLGGEIDAVSDVGYCGDSLHPIVAGDVNSDCRVDLVDVAMLAQNWLVCTWKCEN